MWSCEDLKYSIIYSQRIWRRLCVQGMGLRISFACPQSWGRKNRHDSVREISAWTPEHFQKSQSVSTVHPAVHKCRLKLYHAEKKPYVNMIKKRCSLLRVKAHFKWTEAKWETVLWSDESKFLIHGHPVLWMKEEEKQEIPLVQKPASLMVRRCIRVYWTGKLHIWKGTISAQRYMQVLEQHMLPSRWHLSQGRLCIFQEDNSKPHTLDVLLPSNSRRVSVILEMLCYSRSE